MTIVVGSRAVVFRRGFIGFQEFIIAAAARLS
jgi:hypothetical protein